MKTILLTLVLLGITCIAEAQEVVRQAFSADAGFSRSESEAGLGVGLGAAFLWRRTTSVILADFTIVPPVKGGSGRYYVATSSNGQRCRDSVTGQFVSDSLCNSPPNVFAAAMFDENFILAPSVPLTVGGGYRVGSGQGAYLSLGYFVPLNGNKAGLFVRVIAGADIIQVSLGADIFKN